MAYMFSADYQTARDLGRKAEALDPTYFLSVMLEGWVDIQEGKYKEAIPFFERARAWAPRLSSARSCISPTE